MSGYMFHDEMVKRMMKSTVNPDAQILETAYETGRKQGQMENIKAVLEIIDEVTADYEAMPTEIDVGREKSVISSEKKDGMLAMASLIKVLVLALKGGEQE